MESIRGYFKALKWRSLIVAFSAILLGLLFILTPQASADVICYVAGILLLAGISLIVDGVFDLIVTFAFSKRIRTAREKLRMYANGPIIDSEKVDE